MPSLNLKNMDVDALIELRTEIDMTLTERSRDLQKQLTLLDGHGQKRRGRPATRSQRVSRLRGIKVAPKYRGPNDETWAGRGATPRWLAALLKEGHPLEEFLIGSRRGKKAAVAADKSAAKKGRKFAARKRGRKSSAPRDAAERAA